MDTVTINFSDVRDYHFHPECVTDGLLNTAIIYGKNAVGKTNFGLALFDIVSHLTFQFGEDEVIYGYNKSDKDELDAEQLILNGRVLYFTSFSMDTINEGLVELAPNLN